MIGQQFSDEDNDLDDHAYHVGVDNAINEREKGQMLDYDSLMFKVTILNHLQYNHFPPLPASCVDAACKAIEAVSAGKADLVVHLPTLDDKRGYAFVSAWQIVENMHLDCFLT